MRQYPSPDFYATQLKEMGWLAWARRLITTLKEEGVNTTPTLPRYTVLTLPKAVEPGQLIYVTDETGGAVPAFSDGADWRRVTDRAVVS